MAYRDDLAALEARKLATEAELVEKTRARDELARLVDEARYLARAERAFADDQPDPRRRARRHRLLLPAAAAAVVAGGSVVILRPARPDPVEALFARLATFERAMCECTDLQYPSSSECVQRVSDDMTRWGAEQTKQMPVPPKLDDRQMKRASEMGERVGRCMQRAMTPPEPPVVAPEPAPKQAAEACDEVSCVLDNYEPACCSVFKHAPTTRATQSELPDGLDRSMISAGIASVKGRVMSCGDKTPNAKGKVKVRVTVGEHGRVTQMSVQDAPDPVLGACVAAAVQMASFARTQNGGVFSYPFVF